MNVLFVHQQGKPQRKSTLIRSEIPDYALCGFLHPGMSKAAENRDNGSNFAESSVKQAEFSKMSTVVGTDAPSEC